MNSKSIKILFIFQIYQKVFFQLNIPQRINFSNSTTIFQSNKTEIKSRFLINFVNFESFQSEKLIEFEKIISKRINSSRAFKILLSESFQEINLKFS